MTQRETGASVTNRRGFMRGAAGAAAVGVVGSQFISAAAGAATAPDRTLQFTDTWVDAGDVILAARSIGPTSGETILIMPSLARGARDFDALALLLASSGYRIISVDPRGIGQGWAPATSLLNVTLHTYAADLRAVIGHFGLDKVHVLGHAFGNRVARTLAVDYPDLVKTVILCACGGGTPPLDVTLGLTELCLPTTSAAQVRANTKKIFFAPGNDPSPWYLGWYPLGGATEQRATQLTPFGSIEGGGDKPILIIQGLNDIVAPPAVGHGLATKYGARITVHDIANAGHAMIIEQTTHVASIIVRYLRTGR